MRKLVTCGGFEPQTGDIRFHNGAETVGRLFNSNGAVAFAGDPVASAAIMLDNAHGLMSSLTCGHSLTLTCEGAAVRVEVVDNKAVSGGDYAESCVDFLVEIERLITLELLK